MLTVRSSAASTELQEEAHASPAFQRTRFLAFAIMVTGCKLFVLPTLLPEAYKMHVSHTVAYFHFICRCQLLSHKKLFELCHSCDDARQGSGLELHPDWRPHQHPACLLWYAGSCQRPYAYKTNKLARSKSILALLTRHGSRVCCC